MAENPDDSQIKEKIDSELTSDLHLRALPEKPITYDNVEDPQVRKMLYAQEATIHAVLQKDVGQRDAKRTSFFEGIKIAERVKALKKVSTIDPLTELHNRRAFDKAFPRAVERALRSGIAVKEGGVAPGLAFLIFDLDNFKEVNDTYGHQAGDAVLQQFSGLLQKMCRDTEQPFRWGGEEFAVIADATDLAAAMRFAERIRSAVENYEFKLPDGQKIKRTTSVGVTSMKDFNGDVTKKTAGLLMKKADEALYEAKAGGRNGCMAALKDETFRSAEEIITEDDKRKAEEAAAEKAVAAEAAEGPQEK